MTVPTDDEFLDHLYEEFADHPWAQRFSAIMGAPIMVERALASGVFREQDRPVLIRQMEQFRDPRRSLRGDFITALKEWALIVLGKDADRVSNVPVGLLPTRELNACSARTPRGGYVILLDSAVIWSVQRLILSYIAMDTWATDSPFCKDYYEEDFAKTIVCLAATCATGNLAYIRDAPAMDCPSVSYYDKNVISMAVLVEIFILLHEYGHILEGHLDDRCTGPLRALPSLRVNIYRESQEQEFEADQFALSKMVANTSGHLKETDAAVAPGLLFGFFTLIEAFLCKHETDGAERTTHPPAMDRWRRLGKQIDLDANPSAVAARIEPWFNRLRQFAGL